jgi:hypothetical protein
MMKNVQVFGILNKNEIGSNITTTFIELIIFLNISIFSNSISQRALNGNKHTNG